MPVRFFGVLIMMNLYSGTTCPFSQRCRIVLYEKGMDFQVIDVDLFAKQEDIAMVNPYGRVPVLVERDLILDAQNHPPHEARHGFVQRDFTVELPF